MESQAEMTAPDALVAVADARSAAADRLVTPWWYHPVVAFVLAAYVAVVSLAPSELLGVTVVALVAASVALERVYKRLTGVWVWGYAAGRASRWTFAMAGVLLVALITSWLIAYSTSLTWPTFALAAVTFVAAIVLGRKFDNALRRQLREDVRGEA